MTLPTPSPSLSDALRIGIEILERATMTDGQINWNMVIGAMRVKADTLAAQTAAPAPMDAVDRIGLACRHGEESSRCAICKSDPERTPAPVGPSVGTVCKHDHVGADSYYPKRKRCLVCGVLVPETAPGPNTSVRAAGVEVPAGAVGSKDAVNDQLADSGRAADPRLSPVPAPTDAGAGLRGGFITLTCGPAQGEDIEVWLPDGSYIGGKRVEAKTDKIKMLERIAHAASSVISAHTMVHPHMSREAAERQSMHALNNALGPWQATQCATTSTGKETK